MVLVLGLKAKNVMSYETFTEALVLSEPLEYHGQYLKDMHEHDTKPDSATES
jgi:hypothetical protein